MIYMMSMMMITKKMKIEIRGYHKVKTISLRAESDGISVYKKIGFKECFRRVVASCQKV
jgi:hypothetical protein